jgi:hypothetical protein
MNFLNRKNYVMCSVIFLCFLTSLMGHTDTEWKWKEVVSDIRLWNMDTTLDTKGNKKVLCRISLLTQKMWVDLHDEYQQHARTLVINTYRKLSLLIKHRRPACRFLNGVFRISVCVCVCVWTFFLFNSFLQKEGRISYYEKGNAMFVTWNDRCKTKTNYVFIMAAP